MNNARFATLIHILTLLDKSQGQWMSSEMIAGSININPVMVRKELGVLQDLGWVVSKKGKEGGSMLQVASDEISLADIYQAANQSSVLGRKHQSANPQCPVGRDINGELESLFGEADQAVIETLSGRSLKSFSANFD